MSTFTMRRDDEAEWERVRSWTRSAFEGLSVESASDDEQERKDQIQESLRRAAPVVEDLRRLGIPLSHLDEMGNVRIAYPRAVPVLIMYLDSGLPDDVSLSIVHALTKPYGAKAFAALLKFLRRSASALSPSGLFAVGSALAANARRPDLPDLLEIIADRKMTLAREPLALRVARWADECVRSALQEYLRDGESPWSAIRALRLAKAWAAVADIEPHAASKSAEVRSEVRKYMQEREKRGPAGL